MIDLSLVGDVDGVAIVFGEELWPDHEVEAALVEGDPEGVPHVKLDGKPWKSVAAALEAMKPSVVVAWGPDAALAVLGREVNIDEASGTVLQSRLSP